MTSTAAFLAHTVHADRERRDRVCAICAVAGPTRVTWTRFVEMFPENDTRIVASDDCVCDHCREQGSCFRCASGVCP